MMSLPKIVEREALPYVSIAETVTIPFQSAIDRSVLYIGSGAVGGQIGDDHCGGATAIKRDRTTGVI